MVGHFENRVTVVQIMFLQKSHNGDLIHNLLPFIPKPLTCYFDSALWSFDQDNTNNIESSIDIFQVSILYILSERKL